MWKNFFFGSLSVFVSVLSSPLSWAHDVDCKGKPPSLAIKQSCCGKGDAHMIQAGQFRQGEGDLWYVTLRGVEYPLISTNGVHIQPLPSEDGCNYVWYRTRDNDGQHYFEGDDEPDGRPIHFYCLEIDFGS